MISPAKIEKLDKQKMLSSIKVLHLQCQDAWQATSRTKIPKSYKKVNKIAVFGMGGSALGADVMRQLFAEQLKIPCYIINDYQIPAWVDKNTLAILSSYSGSTEETVTASKNILKKTKEILVITSGKNLKSFKNKHNLPGYLIDPKYNPCGQPRMALGYAIVGLLGLLKQTGLIKLTNAQIKEVVEYIDKNHNRLSKLAQQHAQQLKNRAPLYAASEFLLGNAHVIANQTNENGKNYSSYFAIPELNHHLMEGLGYPKNILSKLFTFVFINSNLYHPRNQKRHQFTKKIVQKNNLKFLEFKPRAKTKLLQSFETLTWGSYLTFYFAMVNQLDPSPIPWVDYFKKQLG